MWLKCLTRADCARNQNLFRIKVFLFFSLSQGLGGKPGPRGQRGPTVGTPPPTAPLPPPWSGLACVLHIDDLFSPNISSCLFLLSKTLGQEIILPNFCSVGLLLDTFFYILQGPRGGRGARGPTGKPGAKVRRKTFTMIMVGSENETRVFKLRECA